MSCFVLFCFSYHKIMDFKFIDGFQSTTIIHFIDWAIEASPSLLLVLWTRDKTTVTFDASLLSGLTNAPGSFYISCSRSRISHFPKDSVMAASVSRQDPLHPASVLPAAVTAEH